MQEGLLELRQKLSRYNLSQLAFNEPHFSERLQLRGGSLDEAKSLLLDPRRLESYEVRPGKYGDLVYSLHYKTGRYTIIMPAVLGRKTLYIMTYIRRYR